MRGLDGYSVEGGKNILGAHWKLVVRGGRLVAAEDELTRKVI